MRDMRNVFAAILMLVFVTGQVLALAGPAAAAVLDGAVVSVTDGAANAVPVEKRVCWRKTLYSNPAGKAGPVRAVFCGADTKFVPDCAVAPPVPGHQVYGMSSDRRLFGRTGDGPLRPPIS